MHILLIDNTSLHIEKLAALFEKHKLECIPYTAVSAYITDSYDLIVLSGGSVHSLIGNEEKFALQIELVKTTQKPVIGICFGFQLLAYSYGAPLRKLKQKAHGFQPVDIIDPPLKKIIASPVNVYESHSWYVPYCPETLTPLAVSPSGVEAFKHINKPHYGLQFHPEITDESNDGRRIFDSIFSQVSF